MASQVEVIHRAILEDAADIANALILDESGLSEALPEGKPLSKYPRAGRFNAATRKPRYAISGQFYRPDPNRTRRGGLVLSLDESVQHLDPNMIFRLREIARIAMIQALRKNHEKLGYLVVTEAMNGRNYFDRFRDSGEQLRIL